MKKLLTILAVIDLILVGCVLSLSTVYAQTPTPQLCTDFETFNLLNDPNPSLPGDAALPIGTVHGQDGWTPANLNGGWTVSDRWGYTVSSGGWPGAVGLAFDEQVVALTGGGQAWRMSNARYFGTSFSAFPFSSVLPDALVAGETGAYLYNDYGPDHTKPLGEPANRGRMAQTKSYCVSFDFASATGVFQPDLRLDVNAASKQSATRYTLTKLEDLADGLAVSYYDMDLGVYLPVARGLARNQWHNLKMEIQFVDGIVEDTDGVFWGNDIVTISVDGGPAVVSTTWESYYAQYEPARYPLAVDSLRFMPRTAISALLGGGFLFDNVCSPCPPPPNAPPDCSRATPSVSKLWSPDHKFVPISILGVTDPDGDPVSITINSIFQDEPVKEVGSGSTCPDATGVGTATAQVRAERSGTGDGRVYHISFTADDGRGGTCTGEVKVCVPHDQGKGNNCVDEGALFNSTVCR